MYNKFPSKNIDDYWVFVESKKINYNYTLKSGKWLIFIDVSNLDFVWQKIADATEKGLLGLSSKASTSKENPNSPNQNIKVICIYTYNSDDVADVSRIAWNLYKLGVVGKVLNYKEDKSTIDNKYANRGHKNISKYSISISNFNNCKNLKEFFDFFKLKYVI
jgi:hypothetical protein